MTWLPSWLVMLTAPWVKIKDPEKVSQMVGQMMELMDGK